MAAVISEFVTDATRLYHDSHSIMGGHAQNGSSTSAESLSQHSYNNRLNTPQSQHIRTVPPSPRPQPTSIPQGTPPRAAVQRATGESGITSDPTTTARPSVQRAATHGADSSRHVGNQQRTDASIRRADTQTTPEELRRRSMLGKPQVAENTIQTSASWTSSQPIPQVLTRAGLSLQDVRNHGGRRKNVIEVKSLDHIQSFASEEFLSQSRRGSRRTGTAHDESGGVLKYDISDMPVADIIEMVAGLLTKITTTNDRQHESLHRNIHVHSSQNNSTNVSSQAERDGQGMSPMTSSVLAFHGKNVPPITILSYLSRIHKYCPTTYDVFLSLLVYFDRMTERVNAEPLAELKRRSEAAAAQHHHHHQNRRRHSSEMEVESEEEDLPQDHSDPSDENENENESEGEGENEKEEAAVEEDEDIADSEPSSPNRSRSERDLGFDGEGGAVVGKGQTDLSHFFVVDGFNIHRLVIAGVTCASKFFSDVFYTNSRYAKVGGLPLNELNHLELQFLLLNDFRLSVPVEELEAYGTMLVEFYAREVIEQRKMEREEGDVVMMGS